MASRDTKYTFKWSLKVVKGKEADDDPNVERKDVSWEHSITEEGASRPMTGGSDFWNDLPTGVVKIKGFKVNPHDKMFQLINRRFSRLLQQKIEPKTQTITIETNARGVLRLELAYGLLISDLGNVLGKRGYRGMPAKKKNRRTKKGRGD